MSSSAGQSSNSGQDVLSLLPQFINLLRSPSIPAIPLPTLLGAITHFLCNLDSPHLEGFISALVTSPFLWSDIDSTVDDVRNTIRLAVPARISKINQETQNVYFAETRKKRRAREWLHVCVKSAVAIEDGPGTYSFLFGILQGLDDTQDLDWGKERVNLEETAVLFLAGKMNTSRDTVKELCIVIPHIALERLQALDMEKLVSAIDLNFHATFDILTRQFEQEGPTLARALARSFEVLESGGPSSRKFAWESMKRFCMEVKGRADNWEKEWIIKDIRSDANEWQKRKTAFFSFLLVSSTILEILLRDNLQAPGTLFGGSESSSDIAAHILSELASFAYLTEESQGGFENYHEILYGCLDIIDTRAGTQGVRKLFDLVCEDADMSDARAGFVLVLGEELVHHLGKKQIDMLFPLAERHVVRPSHHASFEASHAFMLTLLKSSAASLESSHSQEAFFDALLPNYLDILTKQYRSDEITPEQFRQAFPLIVGSSSKRSPDAVQNCLSALSTMPETAEIRKIRVSITPYIPSTDLPLYLDDLAQMIVRTGTDSEERLDLVKSAFEMIVRDMSDAHRSIGIDWWLKWKTEFEGTDRQVGFIRSRL
ncbi:uncharacterized protein IL334_006491 [Kwoniella shivajii]|uniref:Uncharacterized protein n=1 Tax=Kwoniella shivajii TaxID=564305 RepID=A0ABZ1D639_9TREE|nr:hypothetical protein IL334_006491 [Kwoniella shivajii]